MGNNVSNMPIELVMLKMKEDVEFRKHYNRPKLKECETVRSLSPLEHLVFGCTDELREAFLQTNQEIEQNIAEQNKLLQLFEDIAQQTSFITKSQDRDQVLQIRRIVFVQDILRKAEDRRFRELYQLYDVLGENQCKIKEQRAQRENELLQEWKQIADAQQEMANLLEEKHELKGEHLQRIRVLDEKIQQHHRRVRECDEIHQQITERTLCYEMPKENAEKQGLEDDNIMQDVKEDLERSRQLTLQSHKKVADALAQQRINEYTRTNRNNRRCKQLFDQQTAAQQQQQQQPEVTLPPPKSRTKIKLSELSSKQHDELMIYKIFNDRILKKRIRSHLPITQIIQFMSLLSLEFIMEINRIEKDRGNYAAVKKCFQLFAVRKTTHGWSHQLLQSMDKLSLEDLKELLTPNENDLVDFLKRSGVPRNSLLEQISCHLRKDNVLLTPMGRKTCADEKVPVVHPKLLFPRRNASQENEVKIETISIQEPNDQTPEFPNKTPTMLRDQHVVSSVFLVGTPGSGKSTIAKRMVKAAHNDDNKMAFFIPLQRVPYDQSWSLKNLLLEFSLLLNGNENTSANKIERDFELILANQEKCLIVFDGLDEIEFQIPNPPVEACINDELPLGELLSLILSRRFLPQAKIITACRPHTLTQLVSFIQPAVICVGELPESGLQKLMKHYIPSEDSENILKTLEVNSPEIYDLIHTPLFFQLFVKLYRDSEKESIWSQTWTTAKLFSETIKIHLYSANFARQDMIEDLNLKLGKMAYEKTMDRSTIFEESDLDGLSADDVQDFMFSYMGTSPNQNESSMGKLFRFHHLSVQEYLASEFALKNLSVDQFQDFLTKIFPRVFRGEEEKLETLLPNQGVRGRLEIGEDKFANVRMLIIGCINELDTCTGEILLKRQVFVQRLCAHLRQICVKRISAEVENYQFAIMKDLMDLTKDDVVEEIREELKTFNFWFGEYYCRYDVALNKEFRYFVGNFVSNVKCFSQVTENLEKVSELIQSLDAKMEEAQVHVALNPEQSHVNDIVAIFPKLERKLIVQFDDCDNPQRQLNDHWEDQSDFWRKLNKEIQKFDTNALRTEKLELKFRSGSKLFLSCTLQRGKPPPKLVVHRFSDDAIKTEKFGCFIFKLE